MTGFISHIDFRVRDTAAATPFYDALFAALGLRPAPTRTAFKSYARFGPDGIRSEWFNLVEDPAAQPSTSRIAFRADSRDLVDAVHHAIAAQPRNIEGPDAVERSGEFNMSYCGIFFEDALGNKFEVCHCIMQR